MRRILALAAMIALAMPTMAMAQGMVQGHGKGGPPRGGPPHGGGGHPGPGPRGGPGFRGPGGPGGHGPVVRGPVHGGPVRVGGPGFGHPAFVFHGHPFAWHPVRFPRPWVYPPGFGYRLWTVGAILPPLFWATPTYYYTGWAGMGLPPPDPGYQYVQYGPDLLLVNVSNGQVVQVFPGAFS